jgi:hypothetical protein
MKLVLGSGKYLFIDTNSLKTVHPFGRAVFEKNLSNLIFIEENGHKISPN